MSFSNELHSDPNKVKEDPCLHGPVPAGCAAPDEINLSITDGPLTTQPDATITYPVLYQEGAGEDTRPVGIPVCPPGLEYLTMVDQLLVHTKTEEIMECETRNKYDIKNSMGQTVFTTGEDSDCCIRCCVGQLRPFLMPIKDPSGKEVITFNRGFNCVGCCCPCCMQRMEIYSPPGILVGKVLEEWTFCGVKYRVENAEGVEVFRITNPPCKFSCFPDIHFPIYATNGEQIGKIRKEWPDLAFTEDDHFGVSFPMDLDATMKAVLLGALFLFDFNFFEMQ